MIGEVLDDTPPGGYWTKVPYAPVAGCHTVIQRRTSFVLRARTGALVLSEPLVDLSGAEKEIS